VSNDASGLLLWDIGCEVGGTLAWSRPHMAMFQVISAVQSCMGWSQSSSMTFSVNTTICKLHQLREIL